MIVVNVDGCDCLYLYYLPTYRALSSLTCCVLTCRLAGSCQSVRSSKGPVKVSARSLSQLMVLQSKISAINSVLPVSSICYCRYWIGLANCPKLVREQRLGLPQVDSASGGQRQRARQTHLLRKVDTLTNHHRPVASQPGGGGGLNLDGWNTRRTPPPWTLSA